MEHLHPANQPAFPHSTPDGAGSYGMSRREYYAALNMAQMMRATADMHVVNASDPEFLGAMSAIAVSAANALIRELERTKPEDPKPMPRESGSAAFVSVNSANDDMPF